MSISTLVAVFLLALPSGDCSGGCSPQHRLPLGGLPIAPSLGGESTERGEVEGITDGEGLVPPQPPEPAAPVVFLRSLEVGAADPQSFLASSDRPAYCTAVPFAPLSVQVQVPIAEAGPSAVEYLVLLLDGKPVEKNRYSVGPQQWAMPITEGWLFTPYVFYFPCPAPGKHILQAKYKKAGLWSRVSEPLHFDVRLPDPPQIVAMSDIGRIPVPVKRAGLISIIKPEIVVRLANVSQNTSVVAYLDGRPISTELSQESCCRKIRLEGHLTPGTHSLRLRTTTSSGGCSVTSDSSPEVLFHYYDSDIYLLRPGRSCDNRKHGAQAGCQCEGCSATKSEAAGAASKMRSETPPAKDSSSSVGTLEESAQTSMIADRPPPCRFAGTAGTAGTAFLLAAFQASDPIVEAAQQLFERTVAFRDLTAQAAEQAARAAESAGVHAGAAEQLAGAAAGELVTAEKLRADAEQESKRAAANADQANRHTVAAAEAARNRANAAKQIAATAFQQASAAATRAAAQAKVAFDQAQLAKARAAAAAQARDAAATAKQQAAHAAAQAGQYLNEVRQHVAGHDGTGAEAARRKVDAMRIVAEAENAEAVKQSKLAADCSRSAAACRQLADEARGRASLERQNVAQALKAAAEAVVATQQSREAAEQATEQTVDVTPAVAAASEWSAAHAAAEAAKETLDVATQASQRAARFAGEAERQAAETARRAATAGQNRDSAGAPLRDAREATKNAAEAVAGADCLAGVIATRHCTSETLLAQRHAGRAQEHQTAAEQETGEAEKAYVAVLSHAAEAEKAARDAESYKATSQQCARVAAERKAAVATECEAAIGAATEAKAAADRAWDAVRRGDLATANKAVCDATAARTRAEQQAAAARKSTAEAENAATAAQTAAQSVRAAQDRAAKGGAGTVAAADLVQSHAHTAQTNADDARKNADFARTTLRLESEVEAAWDDAESKEIHAKADDQLRAARAESSDASGEPARLRRAELDAQDSQLQAGAEERLAEARIAAAEAAARIERARAVEGPPSPFYFASAAHFPLPDFGAHGEMIDRGGLTIYEDMEFRFDRNGKYEVRFRATAPAMPTIVQLQFQIQPRPGGPWYTVTLAPIEFKYPDPNAAKEECAAASNCPAAQHQQCCGPVRECVCKGQSEVLRRCYGEMGKDARMCRTGTARFGFGVDVP